MLASGSGGGRQGTGAESARPGTGGGGRPESSAGREIAPGRELREPGVGRETGAGGMGNLDALVRAASVERSRMDDVGFLFLFASSSILL